MASEIRVNKINSRTGVGTITLSPTGVDFTGIATVATLKATTGIVTTLSATGNATVGGTLSVTGDVDVADKIVHTGDTDTAIRFPAADTFTVETAGSERFRIDSTGNTLIYGVIRKDNVSSSLSISGGNGADSSANIVLHGSSGSPANVIQFRTGSTERLRITSGGLVGVNVTPTQQKLTIDVNSSGTTATSFDGINICNTDSTTNNGAAIVFGQAIAGNSYARIGVINSDRSGGSEDQDIFFGTLGGGSYAERLRITSVGKMGLGETTPLGNLHVKSGDSGASSVGPAADELVLENSTDSGMTFLSGTSGYASINFADSNDANVGQILYSHGSNYLAIKTNDSERLRVLSGGGLTFNGDTAAANALDDYEEGTWTPNAQSGASSFSVDSDNCSYVKFGSLVSLNFEIYNPTSLTNDAFIIGGLPFQPYNEFVGSVMVNSVNFPSNRTMLSLYVNQNNRMYLYASGHDVGWTNLTGNQITSNGSIIGTITYRAQ